MRLTHPVELPVATLGGTWPQHLISEGCEVFMIHAGRLASTARTDVLASIHDLRSGAM